MIPPCPFYTPWSSLIPAQSPLGVRPLPIAECYHFDDAKGLCGLEHTCDPKPWPAAVGVQAVSEDVG
jgi:hypothetical protein